MPRAVIFDVDGTLVDSNDGHARSWVETFRHFGYQVAYNDVRRQLGKGSDQLTPVFLPADEIAARGAEIDRFRSELYARDHLPQVRAFPGVRALFERIRQDGTRIVIASSGQRSEVDHHMATAHVEDLIDCITTADDAEKSKPAPDIFEAAVKRIGPISAREAIVVGDTPYDAIAAGKAGLATVGLLCGGFSKDDLVSASCVEVYRDPEHLLAEYDRSALSGR